MVTVFSSHLDKIYKCMPKIFHKFAAWDEGNYLKGLKTTLYFFKYFLAVAAVKALDIGLIEGVKKTFKMYKMFYKEYQTGEKAIEFDHSTGIPTFYSISPKSSRSPMGLNRRPQGFGDAINLISTKK